ncbi:MAG: hypothetical protein ACI4TM_04050, partial [Candidatus Cryptobacteroides sp.]
MNHIRKALLMAVLAFASAAASAQRYPDGIVDKTIAVVGNEMITISQIEEEVQMLRANGYASDKNVRCEILENMLSSKLFLMQARIDSITVNNDMVENALSERIDNIRMALGGDEGVEQYFGKPLYKLRQEWRQAFQDQSLTEQMKQNIARSVPDLTPYDVQAYLDSTPAEDLPVVPVKYKLSQICIYPDREAAALAVKERLLDIRERIINGEKFST